MQLSNFFVKNSSLRQFGLNRFMYYENTVGSLVSPAVQNIYIVLVKDGYGYFNGKKLKAGDVFAYGFNMHPLIAENHNLTFLGVEAEFHFFHQLTGLLPSYCQDVMVFEPKDAFTRFLNNQLLYFPIADWIPQVEKFVLSRLAHLDSANDIRSKRLIYTIKSILQTKFMGFDRLTQELGISYRNLQRDFSYILGITPKQYQSVHRVYQAAEYIKYNKLNEAAFLAGYADQAHMNRDFKRFTGITPNQVNVTHQNDSKLYLPETANDKPSAYILPY